MLEKGAAFVAVYTLCGCICSKEVTDNKKGPLLEEQWKSAHPVRFNQKTFFLLTLSTVHFYILFCFIPGRGNAESGSEGRSPRAASGSGAKTHHVVKWWWYFSFFAWSQLYFWSFAREKTFFSTFCFSQPYFCLFGLRYGLFRWFCAVHHHRFFSHVSCYTLKVGDDAQVPSEHGQLPAASSWRGCGEWLWK